MFVGVPEPSPPSDPVATLMMPPAVGADMEVGVTVGASIERIERVGDGFSFVEFGLAEARGVPEDIDVPALEDALAATDVALDVHLPFKQVLATPIDPLNEAIVTYLDDLLAWAGDRGARTAVLHGTTRNPHAVEQRELVAAQLEAITATGNAHEVEVVVENVGHQAAGLPLSVLGEIAAETDTPLCFDVGHAYMEDGNDGIDRFLHEHAGRVAHLHLHDVRGRGDTHMPLGAGEIDFSLVAEHLAGFTGTVAIEVFTDDTALLEDSARRAKSMLEGRRN